MVIKNTLPEVIKIVRSAAEQILIRNPGPKRYTCSEIAKLSGLTTHVLRVWEHRYGWPRPSRDPHNGYRVYRTADVENATKIAAYIRDGWTIGQLIHDGRPVWPGKSETPAKSPRGWRAKTTTVENRALAPVPSTTPEPEVITAENDEECTRCGAEGGDAMICDACSATFCSKCDTGGKCPSCGETLP
jgi:MerR HTH family regulatory protein